MPITPLHMGPALLGKAVLDNRISLIAFGFCQVLIDIEPLLGLILRWPQLHGVTHTLPMVLLLGLLSAGLARWLSAGLLARWNKEMVSQGWLCWQAPTATWSALLTGGLLGGVSHLLLDALMHGDMRPLWPFSAANPLYELITYEQVEWLSLVCGLLGSVLWGWRRWRRGKRSPTHRS